MRILFLWVILILGASVVAQINETVQLDKGKVYVLDQDVRNGFDSIHPVYQWEYTTLTGAFRFLVDAGKDFELITVQQAQFFPYDQFLNDARLANKPEPVIWAHGRLKGSAEQDGEFLFQVGRDLESFSRIDVYALDTAGGVAYKQTGSGLSPAEKDVRDAFNFFWLPVAQGQVLDLYLRLEGYAGDPAAALSLWHICPESMRELEGCLLKNSFHKANSGEELRNYTKFSRSIEHLTDAGFTFEEVSDPDFWDRHARFNDWQDYPMRDTFWLRGRLINTEQKDGQFFFYLQKWTHADLYLPDEDSKYQLQKSGTLCPVKEKAFRDGLNLFYVPVSAGDTVDIFARVFSTLPSLSLPFHQEFSIAQVDDLAFFEDEEKNSFVLLFQGYLIAVFLIGFATFLMIPQRVVFYFVICVLGNIIYAMFDYPMYSMYELFPQLITLKDLPKIIYPIPVMIGGIKFVSYYVGLSDFFPRSRRMINSLIVAFLVIGFLLLILTPLKYELAQWLDLSPLAFKQIYLFVLQIDLLLGGTGFFLIFFISLYGKFKGVKYAGILTLSTVIPALSSTAYYIMLFFFTEPDKKYEFFTPLVLGEPIMPWFVALHTGIFAFVTVMIFLIALKVRDFNRERQQTLQARLADEQKVARQLRKVDALKDQFLANTSHELRTPLQGIIGLSESLLEQETDSPKKEDLSLIVSSGKRLNNLVNDILDFSKLKHYDLELRRKPVNLQVLTDIVLKNNAILVKGKDLRLVNAVPRDLPDVLADENRLQQILYNLVGNAIKFTEKGYVKVFAEAEEGMVRVGVEDTGIGIPEYKREAIFEEFEQADASVSREFAGTGLGLSISKQLVALHGGDMWVESNYSDQPSAATGSTFYFTLPISRERASTLLPEKQAQDQVESVSPPISEVVAVPMAGEGGREGIHILVVDDEPVNQRVLKNYLAAGPYWVTQAMDGQEALKKLEEDQSFDLVLLDIMMPKMSGYEVCQKIREKYLPSELPVIMVTAKNQVKDLVEGLALGANDYITKPFSKDEFLARLNTQLDLNRIFDVTGRFVPNEFIRALGKNRITEITLGDHAEREVTVLFADIRNYTSLAESMTPEDTYRFVNAFHGRMGPVILKNNGFVNQYLGDAVMAIFPAKPADAVQAAIEMQQVILQYNKDRQAKKRKPIAIGVGMHTGTLIMGIIGDDKRMDAATIADTVNTASRIESLTKFYQSRILLSENVFEQIAEKDKFHFRYLGKVQVKGRKEPVGIYECFDGDNDAGKHLKRSYSQKFHEGLELFFAKDFPRAALTFQEILKLHPSDWTARLFRDKAAMLTHTGVPDDWDGVEKMESK